MWQAGRGKHLLSVNMPSRLRGAEAGIRPGRVFFWPGVCLGPGDSRSVGGSGLCEMWGNWLLCWFNGHFLGAAKQHRCKNRYYYLLLLLLLAGNVERSKCQKATLIWSGSSSRIFYCQHSIKCVGFKISLAQIMVIIKESINIYWLEGYSL